MIIKNINKMRKFLLILVFFASFVACDPIWWLTGYNVSYFVKNNTDESLVLFCHGGFEFIGTNVDVHLDEDGDTDGAYKYQIEPGDSALVCTSGRLFGDKEFPPFEDMFLGIDSTIVCDTERNELCQWILDDENDSKHDFFRETQWRNYIIEGSNIRVIWVFDINTEDIQGQPL